MKPPKEIWATISEIGRMWTSDERFADHFYENRTHKYISEQHHLEQIEVLKKEIDELRYQLENRNSEGIPKQ